MGLMAPYVGRRYALPDLSAGLQKPPEQRPFFGEICAYEIPALTGVPLNYSSKANLLSGLRALWQQALPSVPVPVDFDTALAPFEKYGIIHGAFEGPRDESTGDLMVLEIFGEVSPSVFESRANPPLSGRFILQKATYSNVWFVTPSLPLYL